MAMKTNHRLYESWNSRIKNAQMLLEAVKSMNGVQASHHLVQPNQLRQDTKYGVNSRIKNALNKLDDIKLDLEEAEAELEAEFDDELDDDDFDDELDEDINKSREELAKLV